MVGTSFQYTTVSPSIVIHAVGRSIDRISIQSKISGWGKKKTGHALTWGIGSSFPLVSVIHSRGLTIRSPGHEVTTSRRDGTRRRSLEGGRRLTAHETDDALIDRIVDQLVAAGKSSGGQSSGEILSAKEPDKRDETDSLVSSDNTNSNNNQQQGDGTKQGESSQGQDGTKGDNPQVVHPAGKASALAQHQNQGVNKGSRVIPTDDKMFLCTCNPPLLCLFFFPFC
ncbi:hypothetical protein RRG08_058068 [Elysia crispata]|uniref:Uncharacterized protein n=1 Tax=Elysia crispata TaxID=231223 RepID=A0AAE1DVG6_9GAST|nr:hypothetical protein RRG08_058068 [Elysia crispata]